MKKTNVFTVGLAMFAMLFGAGNVIFPLIMGRDVGDKLWIGLLGFVITAVLVPFVGLVSVMLTDGSYNKFLGKLGKIPGALIAFVCMMIIGPFAITARCVTISYASVYPYLPQLSPLYYSIFVAAVIFLFTVRENAVMDILGKVLGPLKLVLLSIIIIKGIMTPASFVKVAMTGWEGFTNGLGTGYGTADLLGTIFFSGLIFSSLKQGLSGDERNNYKKLAAMGLKAGAIGALLLGIMYTGFGVVAGFYGHQLVGVEKSSIFAALAQLVLGGAGGLLANMTVAISTLTTAIALNVVFAEYVSKELFAGKIAYRTSLIASIIITAIMSNVGFSGIMAVAMPIISAIYPALIMLSFVNAASVLYGFKWIKVPVYLTFIVTLVIQCWKYIEPFWPIGLV